MINLVQKSLSVRKSHGFKFMCQEIWRYVCDTAEDYSPNSVQRVIGQIYWLPFCTLLRQQDNIYFLHNIISGERFYFPQIDHHRRYRKKEKEKLREVYFQSEFAPLEENEIVFDVGAFVGVSSMVAAEKAQHVYAVEPSPRSFKCLEKNTEEVDNITPIHRAVFNESKEVEFQLGTDASDDSLLEPDKGATRDSVTVSADTINAIATEQGVNKIDLLKIEVEGVEPEAVEGIEVENVSKIVTNCDPERDGDRTDNEVKKKLREMEYTMIEGDHKYYTIIYAKR